MRKSSHFFWGTVLILFGILFLLQNLDYLDVGDVIETFWPVILILIGLKMLLKEPENRAFTGKPISSKQLEDSSASEKSAKRPSSPPRPASQSIHELFGEINLDFENQEVSFLNVSNLLGEIKLDFSKAHFKENALIRISNVIGDVTVKVPEDVGLDVRANYIAGSSEIFQDEQSGFFKNVVFRSPELTEGKTPVQLYVSIIIGNIKIIK